MNCAAQFHVEQIDTQRFHPQWPLTVLPVADSSLGNVEMLGKFFDGQFLSKLCHHLVPPLLFFFLGHHTLGKIALCPILPVGLV